MITKKATIGQFINGRTYKYNGPTGEYDTNRVVTYDSFNESAISDVKAYKIIVKLILTAGTEVIFATSADLTNSENKYYLSVENWKTWGGIDTFANYIDNIYGKEDAIVIYPEIDPEQDNAHISGATENDFIFSDETTSLIVYSDNTPRTLRCHILRRTLTKGAEFEMMYTPGLDHRYFRLNCDVKRPNNNISDYDYANISNGEDNIAVGNTWPLEFEFDTFYSETPKIKYGNMVCGSDCIEIETDLTSNPATRTFTLRPKSLTLFFE